MLLTAFRLTRRSWPMILRLYGVNFLLGLMVLFPAYATLKSAAGHSLEFEKLRNGFDFTVFTDFMHTQSQAVGPLLSTGRWLGLIYLLAGLFFSGGIFLQLTNAGGPRPALPFRLDSFLAACVGYVGRFSRLFLIVLTFLLIWGLICLVIGVAVGMGFADTLDERALFFVFLGCFLLFAFPLTLVLCAGDYAKALLFQTDGNRALAAFGQSLRFVLNNFGTAYGLYLVLLLIGTLCFALYFLAESAVVTNGWIGIGLLFLFQQALILARIFLRVWMLASSAVVLSERDKLRLRLIRDRHSLG